MILMKHLHLIHISPYNRLCYADTKKYMLKNKMNRIYKGREKLQLAIL